MQMISKEQKEMIRSEEIYREEVRREIVSSFAVKNPGIIHRILNILDTQHGRFLASAVLLPVLIWMFAAFQSHFEEKQLKESEKLSITAELKARVVTQQDVAKGGIRETFLRNTAITQSPQFANYSFVFLIAKLSNLSEGEKKESLKQLLTDLKDTSSTSDLTPSLIQAGLL